MKIFKYLRQGLAHYEKGIPCQDYIRTFTTENGNIILAISDGCSSSEFAIEGAMINTQAVINIFKDIDISSINTEKTELKKILLDECFRLIDKDYSSKKGSNTNDYSENVSIRHKYSATLLFAVINTNQNKAVIGHIGDGIIVGSNKETDILYISDAENINSQSNMTYFTTSSNAEDHIRIDFIDLNDIENIFLSSDGAYQMLWEYGFNASRNLKYHAGTSAAHVAHKICTGEIKTNADFKFLLDDLCHYPLLRSDDWSIVIWNKSSEADTKIEEDNESTPIIMMNIEKEKRINASKETGNESIEKIDEKSIEETNEDLSEEANGKEIDEHDGKSVKESDKETFEEFNDKSVEKCTEEPIKEADEKILKETTNESIKKTDKNSVEEANRNPTEEANNKLVEKAHKEQSEESNDEPKKRKKLLSFFGKRYLLYLNNSHNN